MRNLYDGRVEAVLEGEEEAVDAVLRWLHSGPPAARVDSVDVQVEDLQPASPCGERGGQYRWAMTPTA